MSIIKEWSGISESLKKSGASLGDIENARKQFIADIPQKAKSAGLNDEQTQSAISAFDTFTKDQLTEEERYGVDNPIKGGIKQAGKEIYTALAQGAGRMVGGAARLYNDIGDNEKGTFADNLANAMEEDYQRRDKEAGLGYQQAGFGKMMAQNIPQLAAAYLPLAALKGVAALRGAKAVAAAITAGKTVEAANAAKAAAIASTITKGSTTAKAASLALNYTGEYGDVSQTVAQKIKNTTVDELRNSEEYGAEFNALERQYYQQGMSADEASQKAKEYLLDNIRERRADVGAVVNTALEIVAPNAVSAINRMGGKKAGSELTESAVADAIGNKRFSWGNKKEVANLGEQSLQEALQEGNTEFLGEQARANIDNGSVDWGNVANSAALGAVGGGIMGHGVHTLTTGGLQAERAKVLQQLDSISTGYQSATQAVADNKAKLDAINANQGELSASDIVAKKQIEDNIALNQQVADQYEKQLKEAGALSTLDQNPNNPIVDEPIVDANVDTTQANDELKTMAERGDIPDFKTMTLQYGISPENLANMYSRHKKMAQLKANVTEHIKQGDTQAAQEAMSQAGIKQEEADAILDEAIKINTQPKEKTPLNSLSGLLAKNPNADFVKDVLPFLKKKHKINSTSEALALWNEARKANKSATPNAPQPKQSTTTTQTQNTAIEPVVNNETPPTKVTTPSAVPMEVKATPEPVAEIPPVVNNNSPTKDNTEPLVEHTTTKGKTIKGVVRKGITKEEAKLVDPYTFAKDGGFFIREKYLTPQQENTNTAKEEIKRAAKSVAKEVLAEANLSTKSQKGNDGVIEDISGEYQHDQLPDVVATVTKTDKGYEINWGDEVQSFTGKNAADKTQAALKKENFNKKNPDDDNGGVAVEPVAPKPKPVSPSGGVIPRVHLDRISRGLKDGKTVEEIATKIQKSLPHLTIEDVTQQVLAAQEKASKPATLDSIIGKYLDDEEVDEKIRQSGEVLKKFLPETIGDWKIDKSTFATRGAWSVSYTKPHILIDRKTGKEVVSSTTSSAPLDEGVLLSGDEQAIKEHINMRLAKNGITPKGVGEQIAEVMDKTAKAITEAAHNKVVERVKNGEEIVYKRPDAITRVQQDDRYQVELNDKGHAVVKNVKDAQGNWVKPDMSNQSTQAEQRVENQQEIKDEPKAYGKNVVSVYLTQGGQDGLVISKNEDKYHYTGKFGAGSGHSHADMLKIVNGIKSSKRGVKLGYGVEFELVQQSEQKAEQPKQDKPIKKSPLKATASKSEFNKAFGVNESKIDEIAKDFERESQNNSELNPQESKQPTKKETPIQGKDIWMEVEFIAGNKSKELFYHDLMADPNKPFNTEAEAIADWKSKTEEQSNSTIEETRQPTKKERLLIKIDDELDAALDDFAAIFKEQGKRLSSGVDPVIMGKVLAIGMKASTLYLAKGAVKFAVWAENIIAALSSKGVPQETVQPYLKGLYLASKAESSPEIRQQMDKEDDVYDFDFAILNESSPQQDTQNVTTPSQTNGTNARERDKTPESSQVQRASESGLTQDNTAKRDDGVSADSGGRGDRGNLSNESGKSKTRSQESDVGSARNQSSKLTDSTRSPESSDGANLRNYRIQPNELKRTGSWKATAEQNVQIVELVKTIIAENRAATPEEKALLTKFTGWGASEIANGIFPNQYGSYKDASWKALGERLEAALSPEEYAQAKRTTQYAHYTSEPIIRSVYAALSRFGFNGGSLVEPGMGVGLFNGLMPDAMANNSQYTGIEYDTITGNIAKLLYPDSNIIVGDFTETKLPKNFFDVAIGNPPFGSIKIQSDPEYKKQGFLLHDYFFAKTIDRVKEGGLLVFVTSKGTMDKASDRARKYLSDRADLVGAIRLPQTAFKDNAGTEVVTDVIFLRKRMAGEEPAGEAWAGLKEITTPQGAASINEYFATHPEMILGKSALTGSMYRANEYTVEPIAGSDIETLFSEAINNLPENIYTPQRGSKAEQAAVQRRDYDPKIKKEGGIYVADDGVLMQVNNGQGTPLTQKQNSKHELVDLSPKEMQWLKDYVGVRDALKQAQYDQLQDNANWQQSLGTLNKTYDAFVKKHGFMLEHTVSERENEDGTVTVTKRFKNKSIMALDAENALVNAMEEINPDNSISKAPALLGRVINKPSTPVITSTQDAMFVVFNELGRFDLAKVAKLINKSEKDVITELGDSIYEDPSQSWTTADDYLSGNVVRKLKEAEQAARLNPKYQRNVAALKAVQPPALAPHDINVQLGASWIPASDIGLFASEVLGEQRFKVSYSPLTGQWSVEGTANYSSEWGIPAKDSKDILEAVLNNRQIKVTFLDENKKTHTDTEKTEKANDIAKKMRESFKRWLWQDVPRTERLVTYYNEHFNNIAPRVFDGQHLTLPGVSSRFDLRPHQKRAIWRTIQQGDVYYAHAVGAGKTFTMIASGMEERRLGLVKKPMYVVPNHMLAQFSKEFLELYPMANIMVADEQNFHTHNRRKFVAQAALNNPDAIVITHSAFGRIGMSSDYSYKFIKNQIADWQEALQEVGNDERITRKQIERRIEQLENKLKALLDGEKDQLLNFEELGVDRLYVDEGHEFRKLDFPTNRGNIKGIDPSGSQKSMDLYMKVEYLRSKNPSRALVMASGTPVTNTMGELFTVQRFFNPSQLEEDGDSRFDAWSAHYGEVVDGLEQNAAGGYETVSRFAKFVNVPELMSRVRYFMDILTSNQLGDLVQRPDVVGGGRQVIVTPAPDGYKDYQKDLERRIKDIRNRKAPPKPGDDIILSVIGDGRFSAIDMRFVDATLPSDPNSKLNRMLDDLISAYHETANNEYVTSGVIDPNKGSSLMLFTDIGLGEQSAKNRGFDMKAWIEKRLVEGGVKREHIAFMRDNKAHSKKEKLFDDMRQGKKRILIGGKDMETGVNAQKRLTHLFHLDAPWFPASVEQREGRIIRQGNQNKIVAIRAYASKGSYDSTMWGMNSRKARFIEQAMSGDSSVRSMEDVSEASAFEMAAALASGDERYLKLAGLKGDVERLGRLYSAHIDEQKRFAREKAHLESSNKLSASKIEQINAAIAQRKPIKAGEFLANVGKKTFDNRDEFSKALFEKFKEVAESYKADEIELGSIAGFPIVYNGVELRGGNFAADLRVDLPIDVEPLAIFPIDPAYSIAGIATRAVNQTNALDRELISRKNAIEQNTKDLARIGRRIGASFPEMAELNEKQQALNELEQELNAENKADDANVADGDIANDVRFSQQANQPSLTPLDPVNTRNILDRLLRVFAPKADAMRDSAVLRVRVVKSFADLPLVIQEEAKRQGSNDSDIRGVFHNNIFYAVADNLYSAQEVEQTFFHEVYGHYGVRQLFGKSLNVQLNKLWRIIGGIDGMRKFAKEHGVDLTAYEQGLEKTDYSQEVKNLILMDELLAHIAQVRKPSIKQAFNELMGKIRAWLRQKGFAKLASFNNQDLAHILTQARQAARQSVALKSNEQAIRFDKTDFSPTNPDIRFSIRLPSTPPERSLPQKSIRTAKNMARFAGESMMNIWTYKIGTKLSIALKHPRYKRVFDLVQAHLNHVSVEAYEAIELAPDLLGKLDTFEDYSKRLKTLIPFSGNFDERSKNIEAAAKVIFDGTLIDKQEFNETQLRTKGLTDDQITFYKQARSAINISLKSAAKAEMTRVLLLSNVIGEQVARVVTDRELSMDEHKKELLQLIDTKYQAFKAKRDAAIDKKEKVAIEQKMDGLVDAIKTLNKVAKKANKLIEEGYAPLMRYGDYTSSVYDSKGELVDFRMFESASARDEFVEGLNELNLNMKRFDADKANYDDIAAKKYDGFKVITGTMNNSLFEQFKGITPETLALFADTSNIKQTEAYQEYLKLAVSNNSAFKRLIHRKGMMGYSEDLQRVVASFVMSNARRSAKNIYNKLENDAVNAIPKEQGHLQEDAQKLVAYINNPVEEAQHFRNILFLWNLGLSFMFGLVNLTQPFMVTIPKLSEYTTASNAALRVSAATRLAYSATQKGQAPKGFETEYAQAQREGHLDPQNAFVLAGIERGSTGLGSSYWQSLSHGFGLIAQITESMNRKTVFIASMQIGQELQKTGKLKAQGFDSPYDFAIRIIQETQGIYNKGNRGNFARGPFGTVLMMFKQYPIMMVQLMERMAVNPQYAGERDKYRKALLLLLAMLWGAAGATGLPFARDILDVVETVFAWSGKPVNIEREIQVGLGKEAADWVMNGVNAVSPVDVKGRMGMGDLIPATSLLNPVAMGSIGGAQNKEVMQVLGAGGGLVQKFIDGSSALGRGDYRNAVANLAPRSIESMVKGVEMGVTGIYTDRKGNKVRDVSIWDALAKFFDMNPAINARDSRTRGLEARDVMIQGSMARKFKERALDALANNDMAAMDKVDADVAKWNRDNPRYPVEIKARALYRKLRNANKTWQGRDEPPKGMEWMEQYR